MEPILKADVLISEDWNNVIKFFDEIVEDFLKNKESFTKTSYSWASDSYSVTDDITVNIGKHGFVADSVLPTIYISGDAITKKYPWVDYIKKYTNTISRYPVFFYIMRQDGAINKHIDRDYEVPVFQYFINQSSITTRCITDNTTYSVNGDKNTGYVMNTILPHWVDNFNNTRAYSINFRYRAPYSLVYDWFLKNKITI